jgi:hypothetical protein
VTEHASTIAKAVGTGGGTGLGYAARLHPLLLIFVPAGIMALGLGVFVVWELSRIGHALGTVLVRRLGVDAKDDPFSGTGGVGGTGD